MGRWWRDLVLRSSSDRRLVGELEKMKVRVEEIRGEIKRRTQVRLAGMNDLASDPLEWIQEMNRVFEGMVQTRATRFLTCPVCSNLPSCGRDGDAQPWRVECMVCPAGGLGTVSLSDEKAKAIDGWNDSVRARRAR